MEKVIIDKNITIGDFTDTLKKRSCCGCEACTQICPRNAIHMREDKFGFRYPLINNAKCIKCGLCRKVCPLQNKPKLKNNLRSLGGYINDDEIRNRSTSGGAFSAIIKAVYESQYKTNSITVYGAVAHGLEISHESSVNCSECSKFCSSKYTQSKINNIYSDIALKLTRKEMVVFSGTPCQVAGLDCFLRLKNINTDFLLCIEILCAGVPTPLLFQKYDEWLREQYNSCIKDFYWRYKANKRWDFNCCCYILKNGRKKVTDRWFSGWWSLFTQRLLMRPSCELCPYKGKNRIADITLGDLWGVDKEYPVLYDGNKGTSWILINSEKGVRIIEKASQFMTILPVDFEKMKKYQIPSISGKPFHSEYNSFMQDLLKMDYEQLCKKWAKKPNLKLLYQKYVYNNRMRVMIWSLKQVFKRKNHT